MDLIGCYRQAWDGFSRWWIPLCLVAFVAVAINTIPQLVLRREMQQESMLKDVRDFANAKSDQQRQRIAKKIQGRAVKALKKGGWMMLTLAPVGLIVGVILIVWGIKASSKEGLDVKAHSLQAGKRGFHVATTQILAMLIVLAPFPLMVLAFRAVVQGMGGVQTEGGILLVVLALMACLGFACLIAVLLYTLFFYAPQLAADEGLGPLAALFKSQRMVRLSPLKNLVLVLCNVFLQAASAPTIIGLIPATAFVNTARGAAYLQLLESYKREYGSPEAQPEK